MEWGGARKPGPLRYGTLYLLQLLLHLRRPRSLCAWSCVVPSLVLPGTPQDPADPADMVYLRLHNVRYANSFTYTKVLHMRGRGVT